MIQVIIVDDQEMFRESLKILIQTSGDINVLGCAAGVAEAMQMMEGTMPDVVLMDMRMPGKDGVEGTRLIKSRWSDVKVIVLTTFDDDEYVFGALKYGASGYILKGSSIGELSSAIRIAYGGGALINPGIATKVISQFSAMAKGNEVIHVDEASAADLNDNERKIIKAVGHGMSNREISGKLYLSEGTVRNYISNILLKLGLRDRTQLAIWAVQNGMAMQDSDWNG